MPETHSKLALALADTLQSNKETFSTAPKTIIARVIDERLAEIRKAYKPASLVDCPIINHRNKDPECAFCLTQAMRAFILLPEDL